MKSLLSRDKKLLRRWKGQKGWLAHFQKSCHTWEIFTNSTSALPQATYCTVLYCRHRPWARRQFYRGEALGAVVEVRKFIHAAEAAAAPSAAAYMSEWKVSSLQEEDVKHQKRTSQNASAWFWLSTCARHKFPSCNGLKKRMPWAIYKAAEIMVTTTSLSRFRTWQLFP